MAATVRDDEYRALAEFRHRIRRFLNFSEDRARALGLEPRQHQLLLAIRGLPADLEPTIGVLAERLQIVHHSAVELAHRSERRGLVTKRANPRDGRHVLLTITPRGRRVLEKLTALHRDELRAEAPALVHALSALLPKKRARRVA